MRIIFVDPKYSIEEPEQSFPSLVDAIAALDKLLSQGLARFGQVVAPDGLVLVNRALPTDQVSSDSSA
jgi:hypothetical protein